MRSSTIVALFMLLGAFSMPAASVVAAPANTNVSLVNPLNITCTNNGTCLSSFLNSILDFAINIGTIVIVLMLVFVGFKFVAARGAPGEIEKAKTMLLWTIVGALVLLGAKAISLGILATVQALGS